MYEALSSYVASAYDTAKALRQSRGDVSGSGCVVVSSMSMMGASAALMYDKSKSSSSATVVRPARR